MDYDQLSASYEKIQIDRLVDVLLRLRGTFSAPGRVVPETDELAIGRGRRLQMATLFLDICGFSSRPSEDPGEQDAILYALNLFFTEMVRIADDYGGTVEKNTGDGLMAYFEDRGGSPAETGAKRAVAAALTMLDVVSRFINPVLRKANIAPIDFRVGIDHGSVTVARLGAAKRFNSIVAIGTSANIACKMLNVAGNNEIVIGEDVRSRLPAIWQQNWTEVVPDRSGWVRRSSGNPYLFYRYTGRWIPESERRQ
jgi:adenylate cyclase